MQISEELAEIRTVPISDQLSTLSHHLDSNFHTMLDRLLPSLKESMELECARNDQRYGRLRMILEGFKDGFDELRAVLQKHKELMDRLPNLPLTEVGTQTERELLKGGRRMQGFEKVKFGLIY